MDERQPLTRDAARGILEGIISRDRDNKGKLFIPDVAFYDRFQTTEGLQHNAKEIYRWLGIKPVHITIRYGNMHERTDDSEIIVPEHFNTYPYQAAAALCFEVVRTVCARNKKLPTDTPELFTLATLEWGLGILVINGSYGSHGRLQRLHHYVNGIGHIEQAVRLPGFRPADYATELLHYATAFRLPAEQWAGSLSKQAFAALPFRGLRVQHAEPLLVRARRSASRRWWLHLSLLSICLALIIVTATFVWSQRVQPPSTERVNAYQSVDTLGKAYTLCRQAARTEKQELLPNDFFTEEAQKATAERCESIKNRYNYSVQQYNKLIELE